MTKSGNPFRYFNSSPEVIRLVVMMYIRFPLSLRDVEDLRFERGIDIWAIIYLLGPSLITLRLAPCLAQNHNHIPSSPLAVQMPGSREQNPALPIAIRRYIRVKNHP